MGHSATAQTIVKSYCAVSVYRFCAYLLLSVCVRLLWYNSMIYQEAMACTLCNVHLEPRTTPFPLRLLCTTATPANQG